MGGISIWQLLITLLVIFFVFGSRRLSSLGSELGMALKNFKKALLEENSAHEKEISDNKDAAQPLQKAELFEHPNSVEQAVPQSTKFNTMRQKNVDSEASNITPNQSPSMIKKSNHQE